MKPKQRGPGFCESIREQPASENQYDVFKVDIIAYVVLSSFKLKILEEIAV